MLPLIRPRPLNLLQFAMTFFIGSNVGAGTLTI